MARAHTHMQGWWNAVLTATAATAALVASLPAVAADSREGAASAVVRYGDLDVTTDEGLRVLYGRLRQAAVQVCRSEEGRDLTRRRASRECREAALSGAVARFGDARLSALHDPRGASRQAVPLRVTLAR